MVLEELPETKHDDKQVDRKQVQVATYVKRPFTCAVVTENQNAMFCVITLKAQHSLPPE